MNKFNNKTFAVFIILSLLVNYTKAQIHNNLPNISSIYSPKSTTIHPQFVLYNADENYSELYLKLNLKELNFVQLSNRAYQAKIKMEFFFYKSLNNTEMIDSSSKIFKIRESNINGYLTSLYKLKTPKENCFLVIITEDMYNSQKNINFIKIDKSKNSAQNFLLLDSATNMPVFQNYLSPLKTYYLKSTFNADSFAVIQYIIDTTMPAPPASKLAYSKNLAKNSQFYIKKSKYFKFTQPGIYQIFMPDFSSYTYKLVVSPYFPYILTAEDMIPPLKYLTNSNEFNELQKKVNKKLAIDDYWLGIGKNPQTARTLIKVFYNRVQMANYFFTSYKPGWMTDRGMIYIVLGPPVILHKGDDFEEWIYYNSYNGNKVDFNFNEQKVDSLFTDYQLQRNADFYKIWSDAVKSWKSGIVFSL